MAFLDILDICNDAFVLIFGLFLSFGIACGWDNRREKRIVLILCPVLLLIQGLFWLLWGTQTVQKLYPLIAHLPLVLVLVFALKQKLRVALVSVCIAYQCPASFNGLPLKSNCFPSLNTY